jgi:uncharacterized protein
MRVMSNTPIIDETLAIRKALGQFPTIEIALVFGSFATGRARADSDLDIAVQFPKRMPAVLYIAMMNALIDATGRAVDLIDLRTVGGELFGQIMKRHINLIGSEQAMVALASRHHAHEADWMPYYRKQRDERLARWIAQ